MSIHTKNDPECIEKIINHRGKKWADYIDKNGEKIEVFKCNDCYSKDKSLKNYQSCEVYSRIVGYLRPVQQWNQGKKEEFKERKEFKA